MPARKSHVERILFAAALSLCFASAALAQAEQPTRRSTQTGAVTMNHASGPFDVKLTPQPPQDGTGGSTLGHFTMAKHYHGDLEATSEGRMLSAGTDVQGSAGYVAIERVTGTLNGHRGSFSLQHSGLMNRGAPKLEITVVPDSGTDDLGGLTGRMTIDIAPDGKHSYGFDYELPQAP